MEIIGTILAATITFGIFVLSINVSVAVVRNMISFAAGREMQD